MEQKLRTLHSSQLTSSSAKRTCASLHASPSAEPGKRIRNGLKVSQRSVLFQMQIHHNVYAPWRIPCSTRDASTDYRVPPMLLYITKEPNSRLPPATHRLSDCFACPAGKACQCECIPRLRPPWPSCLLLSLTVHPLSFLRLAL